MYSFKDNTRVKPIPCRRLIPDTVGRSCTDTDTDTGLYKIFCTENAILCRVYDRRVRVIYVFGVYVRENMVWA